MRISSFVILRNLAIAGLILSHSVAFAERINWWDNDPAIKPDIPDNNITDNAINHGATCAEAASSNIIEYFDTNGFTNLMPPGQTAEQLMIALKQDGYSLDSSAGPVVGLNEFFENRGYKDKLKAHNVSPTWENIISEMKKGQLLLLSIWPKGGGGSGHIMTIAGWDNTPQRQIGVHDINTPQSGSDHSGSTGSTDFYNITTDEDGNMSFKYRKDVEYNVTRITAVSPVPEPSSFSILVVGSMVLFLRMRSMHMKKSGFVPQA
jgi:hypothetical protein